ncbi:MAG: TetR/AcrR family transcriptional regulator, partial [Bdellovibrionota bacterium]
MVRAYQSGIRSEQRDQTRRELKSQALRLFSKKGFQETQIAAIAKASGVATGTFYVHFKDKGELAAESLQDFNQGFLESLKNGVESLAGDLGDDPTALVNAVGDVFLKYWWEHREIVFGLADHFSHSGQIQGLREGFNPELV